MLGLGLKLAPCRQLLRLWVRRMGMCGVAVSWLSEALAWHGSWCWEPLVWPILLQASLTQSGLSSKSQWPRGCEWPKLCWVVGRVPQRNWGPCAGTPEGRLLVRHLLAAGLCWGAGLAGSRPVHSSLGTSWVDNIQCRRHCGTPRTVPLSPWHRALAPVEREV